MATTVLQQPVPNLWELTSYQDVQEQQRVERQKLMEKMDEIGFRMCFSKPKQTQTAFDKIEDELKEKVKCLIEFEDETKLRGYSVYSGRV